MKRGKQIKIKQAEATTGKQLLQTVIFIWLDMQQHKNTAACCIYQTALSQPSQYAAPRSDPQWRAHQDTCSCPLSASTIYPASGPLPPSGRTFLYYLCLLSANLMMVLQLKVATHLCVYKKCSRGIEMQPWGDPVLRIRAEEVCLPTRGSTCQEVKHPHAQWGVLFLVLELCDEPREWWC